MTDRQDRIETVAKIIYDAMPGPRWSEKPAWRPGTQSEAAAESRALAKRILSTLEPASLQKREAIETRNEEAGFVEFLNYDAPTIVRDIPSPCAILLDLNTRQTIGYRVYDPAPLPVTITSDEMVIAGREFLEAAEAVFNWMNGNDLSADLEEQRPDDFRRVSEALVAFRAALAKPGEQ